MKFKSNTTYFYTKQLIIIFLIMFNFIFIGCDKNSISIDEQSNIVTIQKYENEIIDIVNDIREQNGLNDLKFNEDCYKLSQNKNIDMFDNNYFEHKSLEGKFVNDIAYDNDIRYEVIGENLYKLKVNIGSKNIEKVEEKYSPKHIIEEWMNSPTHKANILNSDYTDIGISVMYKDGLLYATQTFKK